MFEKLERESRGNHGALPGNTNPTRVVAVVLAGGLGTRLRSVLPDLPKPMASVEGRPFIEWVLRYLARQGLGQVVISTGYKADAIEAYFSRTKVGGLAVQCVAESEPLGTAGGFLNAAGKVAAAPEAWLVINGDSLALLDLGPFFAVLEDATIDAGVAALWMEDAARYGSLKVDGNGRLRDFCEKRPGPSWVNAGIYLIRHRLLDRFPPGRPLSWELDVFPELLRTGNQIQVHQARGAFLDIGLPESLAEADRFVRENSAAFG